MANEALQKERYISLFNEIADAYEYPHAGQMQLPAAQDNRAFNEALGSLDPQRLWLVQNLVARLQPALAKQHSSTGLGKA